MFRSNYLASLRDVAPFWVSLLLIPLLVHHIHVATPRDPASARYNEGFHRFFPRVLIQSFKSAWRAEAQCLEKRRLALWHRSNPFWRYGGLQAGMMGLAMPLAGNGALLSSLCRPLLRCSIWKSQITSNITASRGPTKARGNMNMSNPAIRGMRIIGPRIGC